MEMDPKFDADIEMLAASIAKGIVRDIGRLPANTPIVHCEPGLGNGVTIGGAAHTGRSVHDYLAHYARRLLGRG
jgi:hypothetical protein